MTVRDWIALGVLAFVVVVTAKWSVRAWKEAGKKEEGH